VRMADRERGERGGRPFTRARLVAPAAGPSTVSVPTWYALTTRETLEREHKSTAALALGVRPAAHGSRRRRANKSPERGRRTSARMRACSAGGISTPVVLGTDGPR
jgi:hypothetical protein